eukprot:172528-Rhodomonas_salina.1
MLSGADIGHSETRWPSKATGPPVLKDDETSPALPEPATANTQAVVPPPPAELNTDAKQKKQKTRKTADENKRKADDKHAAERVKERKRKDLADEEKNRDYMLRKPIPLATASVLVGVQSDENAPAECKAICIQDEVTLFPDVRKRLDWTDSRKETDQTRIQHFCLSDDRRVAVFVGKADRPTAEVGRMGDAARSRTRQQRVLTVPYLAVVHDVRSKASDVSRVRLSAVTEESNPEADANAQASSSTLLRQPTHNAKADAVSKVAPPNAPRRPSMELAPGIGPMSQSNSKETSESAEESEGKTSMQRGQKEPGKGAGGAGADEAAPVPREIQAKAAETLSVKAVAMSGNGELIGMCYKRKGIWACVMSRTSLDAKGWMVKLSAFESHESVKGMCITGKRITVISDKPTQAGIESRIVTMNLFTRKDKVVVRQVRGSFIPLFKLFIMTSLSRELSRGSEQHATCS